jgi:molecular chaperone IbpA
MTRLEREIDDIVNSLLFPARYAKSFVNNGASYPPYNIIRLDEQHAVLEVAVAGFKEADLNITVEDGVLKVSGRKQESDNINYIYKGIGARAFERSFTLSHDARIERAEYADGILSIFVEYVVPEEKKPNTIPINRGERQYLAEQS